MNNILIGIIIILILYISLNKIYSKYWNKGLSIGLHFDEACVTENDTAHLTEVITNRNFLPIPTLWVKFAVHRSLIFKDKENVSTSDKCYKNDIFSLLFYQKITKNLTFTASKRGFFRINDIDVVASNLFFSDSLVTAYPCDTSLIVYPKLTDYNRMLIPFRQIMGDITINRFCYEDPFEFSRIRPYTLGDSLKDINWKATARTDSLQTNVHAHTVKQGVTFIYNPELDGMLEDADLCEENIRILATLATMLTKEGIPFSFYTSAKDVITGDNSVLSTGAGKTHLNDFLRVLARIDLSAKRSDFDTYITGAMASFSSETNTIVFVSSSKNAETLKHLHMLRANRNHSVFWILPMYRSEFKSAPEVSDMFLWEVTY
ncbi:MAG: DUF58 domain-containing protein [Lachnospiraceae bacterium]|nr:DUF58 domain-containing protein [Lachnospiraceae bacterium]